MSVRRGMVAAAVAVLAAGCSSGSTGQFNPGQGSELTCMEHQTDTPGTAYTSGPEADTASILGVFRYYVSNGDKAYCDGAGPTEIDRQWAQLVVDLGGSKDSVAKILGGS